MTSIALNNENSVLHEPYRSWSRERCLSHFQNRKNIQYFPVIDETETQRKRIDAILENGFEFNHESYRLPEAFDWSENPSTDIEWLILLHKFYYAVGMGMTFHETKNENYLQKWIDLTSSWINTVPLGFLSSDVAGRRIQNWIYAHYYFVTLNPNLQLPPIFYMQFLKSLNDQVVHLIDHLTPARNHRTLELYSIFLVSVVFPEFKEADLWRDFAKKELLRNIESDILADGVHCELSTDYHHIVLKNYLNILKLASLNKISIPEAMNAQVRKALTFSLYVHKPDGSIPSLSDGDVGSFLDLLKEGHGLYGSEEMLYAATQGKAGYPPLARSKGFAESGYYILRSGWGNGSEPYEDARYLVFDCGPLGSGNHGHLDCLSFEMAAYGQSLIVDPGRYTYDESGETNWRVQFRGTSYHNTVLVDRKNQTDYAFHKKKFKIKGPEPDHEIKAFISGEGFDFIHGMARSHAYESVHERKIFFAASEYWIISDHLSAKNAHDYDRLFHLSDRAEGKVSVHRDQKTLRVNAPHLVVAQAQDPEVSLFVETGWVSPSYGVKHLAPVLRFASHADNATYHTILYPYKTNKPVIAVDILPVMSRSHHCNASEAFALCISVTQNELSYKDYYFCANADYRRTWHFGGFTYKGSLLYIRRLESGKLRVIHKEPGSRLIAQENSISNQEKVSKPSVPSRETRRPT